MTSQLRDAALAAAACGWHVFPLRPNDKRPAVTDWECKATTDRDRIERCWSAGPYNVGIATGPSGLVVVDLDTVKDDTQTPPTAWRLTGVNDGADVLAVLAERYAEPFPVETFTVRTGRGGMHLYFTAPTGVQLRNTAGRLGWLIDTRATGGYVVGPGSTVNGRRYDVMHAGPVVELPAWITRLLTTQDSPADHRPTRPVSPPVKARGYVAAALEAKVQRVLDSEPGQRNHTLNAAAFALGRFLAAGLLPRSVVEDALQRAAETVGPDPHKIATTIRNGLDAGQRDPKGHVA